MRQKLIVRAVCLALAFPTGLAVAGSVAQGKPDTLLAVDTNRTTVIDGIVATWGAQLEQSAVGLTSAELRTMLQGLRADKLLAASLAGTLSGLRDVLSNALSGPVGETSHLAQTKALGDTSNNLVYTPVAPCRLVETRPSPNPYPAVYKGDGPFAVDEIRTYVIQSGNGVCVSQLPGGLHPSAVQLQVFGIPTGGASGDLEVQPEGAPFGGTATVTFSNSALITSAGTTSGVNLANNEIAVQATFAPANVAIDLVGYFAAPVATALQCAQVASSSTAIAVSSDTLVALPACAAGYTRTGLNCSGPANTPSGYLVETNSSGCLYRNLSSVAAYNAIATSICCRIPGR